MAKVVCTAGIQNQIAPGKKIGRKARLIFIWALNSFLFCRDLLD